MSRGYMHGICADFRAAARAEVARFPRKLRGLVVASSSHVIYADPESALDLLEIRKGAPQQVREAFADVPLGLAFIDVYTMDIDGSKVSFPFVGINTARKDLHRGKRGFVPAEFSLTLDHYATFYHELGHLLVRRGRGDHYSMFVEEAAADAYAVLRMMQYLKCADATEFLERSRCHVLIAHGVSSHFTLGVIDRIRELQAKTDIAGLSPMRQVRLAGRLARDYHVDETLSSGMARFFRPVRNFLVRRGDMTGAAQAAVLAGFMYDKSCDGYNYRVGRASLRHLDPDFDRKLAAGAAGFLPAAVADYIRRQDQAPLASFATYAREKMRRSWPLPRTWREDVAAFAGKKFPAPK